jgi:hypothetical protein
MDGATLPTDKVDELPVIALDRCDASVPTLPVAIVPSSWIETLTSKLPTDAVDEFPEIASVFVKTTVPTLPVDEFPLRITTPIPHAPRP